MKFSCVKENLARAAGIAERFTGKNITLPILANLLLEVDGNNLRVTGTNLEYALETEVSGKGGGNGKVTVPAKVLSSLLQSLKEEKMELEGKNSNLFISTDSRRIRINGMSPDDFPLIPKIKKNLSFVIDSTLLKHGLEQVIPSVSTSEFKPELSGVQFLVGPKDLRLASTDTFRLAERTVPISERTKGDTSSFVVPQRVVLEVSRTLEENEDVKISIGENQVLVESGPTRVTARLIEGSFPEYSGIVPKSFEATCFISRQDLISAIRSASIFSSKIQEVSLNFSDKKLEISSLNQEVGENKSAIPLLFTGKETKISFNYRYLLDGLGSLMEDEIFLGVNGEASPSLLKEKSGGSFFYVLMPIRLS